MTPTMTPTVPPTTAIPSKVPSTSSPTATPIGTSSRTSSDPLTDAPVAVPSTTTARYGTLVFFRLEGLSTIMDESTITIFEKTAQAFAFRTMTRTVGFDVVVTGAEVVGQSMDDRNDDNDDPNDLNSDRDEDADSRSIGGGGDSGAFDEEAAVLYEDESGNAVAGGKGGEKTKGEEVGEGKGQGKGGKGGKGEKEGTHDDDNNGAAGKGGKGEDRRRGVRVLQSAVLPGAVDDRPALLVELELRGTVMPEPSPASTFSFSSAVLAGFVGRFEEFKDDLYEASDFFEPLGHSGLSPSSPGGANRAVGQGEKTESGPDAGGGNMKWIILGSALAAVAGLVLSVGVATVMIKKRRRRLSSRGNSPNNYYVDDDDDESASSRGSSLPVSPNALEKGEEWGNGFKGDMSPFNQSIVSYGDKSLADSLRVS